MSSHMFRFIYLKILNQIDLIVKKILIYQPFSKKCDIYCNKRYGCINYAEQHKDLQ